MDQTPAVEILVDFDGDVDKTYQKLIEVNELLQMCYFFEYAGQGLLIYVVVVLRFSFELHELQQVEVSAEVHEPVEGEVLN